MGIKILSKTNGDLRHHVENDVHCVIPEGRERSHLEEGELDDLCCGDDRAALDDEEHDRAVPPGGRRQGARRRCVG